MSIIIFADLDGSLIARPETPQPDQPFTMTTQQDLLLESLWDIGAVVPTTGQSSQEYESLRMAFSSRAILAHGLVIREPWGEPEPRWHGIMSAASADHSHDFENINKFLSSLADPHVHVRTADQSGISYRIVVDCTDRSQQHAADLAEMLKPELPEGWRLGRFNHRLGLLAPFVGKARTVAWYLENLAPKAKLVIGIGDTSSDLSFLGLCHFVLTPSDSELFAILKAAKEQSRT